MIAYVFGRCHNKKEYQKTFGMHSRNISDMIASSTRVPVETGPDTLDPFLPAMFWRSKKPHISTPGGAGHCQTLPHLPESSLRLNYDNIKV